MQRRGFIKLLGVLGAMALPFTVWPTRVQSALENLSRPPVKLILPPEASQEMEVSQDSYGQALKRNALNDIEYLSSPEVGGRRTGTKGEGTASLYLKDQMTYLGLSPYGSRRSTYIHPFTVLSYNEITLNGRLTLRPEPGEYLKSPGANLIGGLEGENPNEIIILSAHYDHLGSFKGKVYPGANDNASGVGTVLDVTRRILREGKKPKRTILIAFWSAEEVGFLGSKAFVENPTVPLKAIKAVLNVDTIGNGRTGEFGLWSEGDHLALKSMQNAARKTGLSLPLVPTLGHNSDHISFAQVGIPAITLLAREWLNKNHTPEDTLEIINSEQVKLAAEIVYEAVFDLAF